MSFKTAIISGAKKAGRWLSAKSPTILVITGTVGLVTAGVVACKETHDKLDGIIEEHKQKVQAIKDIRDGKVVLDEYTTEEYAENHYKKHLFSLYLQLGGKLLKAYAPAIGLALISTVAVLSGHKILTGRHLAAVAACYETTNEYNAYREKVKELIGEDKELELATGAKKAIITDTEIDPETGEEKQVSHEGLVGDDSLTKWSYIADRSTVCDYVWNVNSDAQFRHLLELRVDDAARNLKISKQVVLKDVMKCFWKPEFLVQHPELLTDGWWTENPLSPELDMDRPINYSVKMIEGELGRGDRRYVVTFFPQGNIQEAGRAAKAAETTKKHLEKKALRKVKARLV